MGTDDLTCRKHTHKTTYHMQSRYGFDFALSGSVIVSFFVGVDFYLSVWLLVQFLVCGFYSPSRLMDLAAWQPKVTRAPGPWKPRWCSQDLWWGPGSLAGCGRDAVPVRDLQLSHHTCCHTHSTHHAGFLLSLSVTYVTPPRSVLETFRPTCDWSLFSLFPRSSCFHLLWQEIFLPR